VFDFGNNYFTTAFPHTVVDIVKVYYSTAEMTAETWLPFYPGTSNNFIWYEIDAANFSNTYLTTNIRGFFYPPYFSQFTYSFLLLLDNNPFVGSYVVFEEIEFKPGTNSYDTSFPSKYKSGNSLDYTYLIKQIKKIYDYMDMVSHGSKYWMELGISHSNITLTYTATMSLPFYIRNFGNYSAKYLIIIMDKTALANDFPKYHFRALMVLTTSTNYITFNSLPDPNNIDNNFIFGLTGYYFYNNNEPSFKFDLSYTNSSFTFEFYGNLGPGASSNSYLKYAYVKFTYYDCNSIFYIYDKTQNLCFDSCGSTTEYYNTTTASC
jgi:hypothetical protein